MVAAKLQGALERVFGEHLLSLRAVTCSACLSVSSILIGLIVIALFPNNELELEPWGAAGLALIGLLYLVVGVLPYRVRSRRAIRWWLLCAIALLSLFVIGFHELFSWGNTLFGSDPGSSLEGELGLVAAVLALAVVSDFALVTGVRATWRWVERLKFYQGLLLMTANLAIAALALWLPWHYGQGHLFFVDSPWRVGAVLLSLSNAYTGLVALLFFATTVLMLGHWLMWPTVARVVYAAHRYELIRRKKILAGVGVALVGVSIPTVAKVLRALVELF